MSILHRTTLEYIWYVEYKGNLDDNMVEKNINDPRLREAIARQGVTTIMSVEVEAINGGLFYHLSITNIIF